MNACQFLSAFEIAFSQVQPTGYWRTWGNQIYNVFDLVGNVAGYLIRHKYHLGEAYHFDVTFFSKTNDIESNWNPPCVVIEH